MNMFLVSLAVYARSHSGQCFYHQERSFHIGMQKFKSQSGIIYLFKVFPKSVVYKVSYGQVKLYARYKYKIGKTGCTFA